MPDCNTPIHSSNQHDPIKLGMSHPNIFTNVGAIGYYKCIEKEIIQKVNQFTDQSFLSILDKKSGAPLILQENRITVDVFMGQITKMLSSGYILYGAIWNLRDWCTLMSDSSWNQYQKLDKRYGDIGWQPDLRGVNIHNFISPLVPEGEIYITALLTNSLESLGNATIYTNISINLSYQSANEPLTLTVDCSIDMVLNNRISIVKIIKKQ